MAGLKRNSAGADGCHVNDTPTDAHGTLMSTLANRTWSMGSAVLPGQDAQDLDGEQASQLAVPVQPSLSLSITVPPDWGRIDHVRQSMQLSVRAAYAPVLIGDRVGIVVSELLENAIKYGEQGPIRVELEADRHSVRLAVTNHVSRASETVPRLDTHIDWIESFDTPQQAYMACLTMAFQRPDDPDASGSGIGLARVRYEGGCTLNLACPTDGLLTVSALQVINWDEPDQG